MDIKYRVELLKSWWLAKVVVSETEKQTTQTYDELFSPNFEDAVTKSLNELKSGDSATN